MDPDHLRDLFARFGPIGIRNMFGGQGLYADGLVFGLVIDGEIYLKVDAASKSLFQEAGSRAFTYEGKAKPVEMPYWTLPDSALDDPDEVAVWARRAREASLRVKASAARRPAATKKRAAPA